MFPEAIHRAVADALRSAAAAGALPDLGGLAFVVERPRDRSNGDWAANAALVAARPARRAPRDIAALIVEHLPPIPHLERVEVAGPGFVNFTLGPSWYAAVLARAAQGGPGHARSQAGAGERVQVEFVSSNPNGPLHIGHGRGGVVGDVLCRILDYVGHPVEREYYYNDAGAQMTRFAAGLEARARQALGEDAAVPEDGYHGAYLEEWGRELAAALGPELRQAAAGDGARGCWPGAWPGRYATSRRPWRWPAFLSIRGSARPSCIVAERWTRPSGASGSGGTSTRPRERSGSAPPISATRRTGCWSPATAAIPTWPRTWPTTWTSSIAASTGSSTSGGPTTTATCRE